MKERIPPLPDFMRVKTNEPHFKVRTALQCHDVQYRVIRHSELPIVVSGPADVANQLGIPLDRITKTLLVRDQTSAQFALLVLPMTMRADLGAAATQIGARRLRMAKMDELAAQLDYPPNGVSPIGTNLEWVLVDGSILRERTVLVGGGAVGVEIEIATADLMLITNARMLE
jgi:Cys-tRNA(Pro)/Cys-tRNA(Cys) deacylase